MQPDRYNDVRDRYIDYIKFEAFPKIVRKIYSNPIVIDSYSMFNTDSIELFTFIDRQTENLYIRLSKKIATTEDIAHTEWHTLTITVPKTYKDHFKEHFKNKCWMKKWLKKHPIKYTTHKKRCRLEVTRTIGFNDIKIPDDLDNNMVFYTYKVIDK